MLFASRLLIEAVIRNRVKAIKNIHFLEGTEVTRLTLAADDSRRVSGIETRKVSDGSVGHLDGDLIVDCSGRSSRAPVWLEQVGFTPAEREVVDAEAGYSTCWTRRPRPASVRRVGGGREFFSIRRRNRPHPRIIISRSPCRSRATVFC